MDVALERDGRSIACEISVTTSVEHEIGNLEKCLAAGFEQVVLIASERRTLAKARQAAAAVIDEGNLERVQFLTPDELFALLERLEAETISSERVIRGRKVRTTHKAVGQDEKKARLKVIADTIAYLQYESVLHSGFAID